MSTELLLLLLLLVATLLCRHRSRCEWLLVLLLITAAFARCTEDGRSTPASLSATTTKGAATATSTAKRGAIHRVAAATAASSSRTKD